MGAVVTQAITFEKWPEDKPVFETPEDLLICLKDLAESGHRGQVRVIIVDDEPRWDLEINAMNAASPEPFVKRRGFGSSVADHGAGAIFGQCVVLIGDVVEVMTSEQYSTRFETTSKAAKKKAAK